MTRVVAVRHGETDWNRESRMQGWAPVPLNDRGREQAAAVGRWLTDHYEFDRVLASDLDRTRETAELLLDTVDDRPISFESAWRERGLGVIQGLTLEEVESRFPTFGLTETAYRATEAAPEGGESFHEVQERVVGRFEEVLSAKGTTLVVTHGGPLCIMLGYAKGLDLTKSLTTHHPDNCSVTEFQSDGDGPAIVREGISPAALRSD